MRITLIRVLILAVLFSFFYVPSPEVYSQQKTLPPVIYNYSNKLCEWPPRLRWKLYKKYWKWKMFKKWKRWHRHYPHRWRHRW